MKILFIALLLPFITSAQHIEAENYNSMAGVGVYPATDAGGGNCVGSIDNGDWIQYNVASGTYILTMRVASIYGSAVLVSDNLITIPNTGGWQVWKTITDTITAGSTIRFTSVGQGWNINWFELTSIVNNPPPPPNPPQIGFMTRLEMYRVLDSAFNTIDDVFVRERTQSGTFNIDTLIAPINDEVIYYLVLKGVSGQSRARSIKKIVVSNDNGNYSVITGIDDVNYIGTSGTRWEVGAVGNRVVVKITGGTSQTKWTYSRYNLSH